MNDKKTEFERLKKIVAEVFQTDINVLSPSTSYIEDLGADSLELFQFMIRTEEEFAIEFMDHGLERMQTLGDTFSYLQSTKE
ncbi:acyl carrier protein [Clostridia bacterium]|nr:acyl carrier protein [Clostridia bacterium]